ncbi:hypothetical protein AB0K80_04050 [Streptomyces sp. NPDC052682]|uniref:hypothetical protein n=1 Tax=Streptomyces sp. NPDC052682 TaxID=3154954 RepID=UPI00341E5CB8
MSEHDSILQLTGAVLLALAAGAWTVGLIRVLRRGRAEASWPAAGHLPGLPQQQDTGPDLEAVDLTPAERAAFARLVRRLSEGH